MKKLNLHRTRHSIVKRKVIRFIEDNWGSGEEGEIITGNSLKMKAIVISVLKEYKLDYSYGRWSDTWNNGYMVIIFE
jgi:hypothetical protein